MTNFMRMLSGNVSVIVFKSDAVIWWAAIFRKLWLPVPEVARDRIWPFLEVRGREGCYVMFRTQPRNAEESIELSIKREELTGTGAFLRRARDGAAHTRRHASFSLAPAMLSLSSDQPALRGGVLISISSGNGMAEVQEKRIEYFRKKGDRHFSEDGRGADITNDLLLQARAKMSENKVNGPGDAVANEMINQLSQEKIYIITRCFQERFHEMRNQRRGSEATGP